MSAEWVQMGSQPRHDNLLAMRPLGIWERQQLADQQKEAGAVSVPAILKKN